MVGTNRSRLWLVAIGFAIFLAMNSFSLWGFSYLPQFAFGDSAIQLWSAPMTASNIISFFIYAFGSVHAPRIFDRAPFFEAAVFMSCGLILLLGFFLTSNEVLLLLASLTCGIGTTCCFICWENVFALGPIEQSEKQVILGSLLAILPFLLYFTVRPQAILFIVFLLVFFNLLILFTCLRPSGNGKAANEARPPERNDLRDFFLPFFCILMVGIASPVLESSMAAEGLSLFQRGCIVHGANILGACVLFAVWVIMKKPADITGTFSIFYPVFITGFLLFPFLQDDSRIAILSLGTFAFTLFSMVMMIASIETARTRHLRLSFVYPLFAGITYVSHLVGTGISALIAGSGLSHDTQIVTSVFVLLYGCALAIFLLMKKSGRKSPVIISGPDVISERCSFIASQRDFSERQTEVLTLLAHGYDVPSVAKKLFISENTVRTHTKKIYTALDVHSKQDIVDLVNSSEPIWKD